MVYTARLVIVGKTGKDPFAGFVLASSSLPHRRMETRESKSGEKRIYVLPRQGYESDNIREPDVDNYAGVIAKKIPIVKEIPEDITGSILQEVLNGLNKQVIVAFNGHMCKRCMTNISDGMKPEIALDSTLLEFRGLPKDARVGAVVYLEGKNELGYLGINDVDKMEKRIKGFRLEQDNAHYTYVSNTSLEHRASLPSGLSSADLAKHISTEILPDMEKVLAGGVCILRGNEFDIGVYNTPDLIIDSWIKK